MLKIAICDDEELFGQHLKKIVSSYLNARKILHEISLFSSGKNFVELSMNMAKYKIVFLDINMEELDGIETAKELRKLCKDTFVVFVTAYINYTLEGYKVDAIRYILKNPANLQNSVDECMDAILEKMQYTVRVYKLPFKDGARKINADAIIYIESRLHEVRFYLLGENKRENRMDDTLNNIESYLNNKNFVRIHQSFLVNMKYIKSMKSQKALLLDGTELPIAKPRYKDVRNVFADYKGEL